MKYLIMPLRMPKSGAIFAWLVFCPDGNIYAEDSFDDAIERMDNHQLSKVAA